MSLLKYLEENRTPLIVASVACNFHPENYRLGGVSRFSYTLNYDI